MNMIIIAIWVAVIFVVLILQAQVWREFVRRYPELKQKYTPGGSALLIPYPQFIAACKSSEVRRACMQHKPIRLRLIFMLAGLIVYVAMIPTMLRISCEYF